mgnify:CR=1 FL=1
MRKNILQSSTALKRELAVVGIKAEWFTLQAHSFIQ